MPVDISFITSHIENIKSVFGTLRYLCQQSESINNNECNNMLQPLDALFNDIVRDYNSISHLLPTYSKRAAWFSAVGTVFKHIFGTLDEDDAQKYSRAIRKLQTSNKDLAASLNRNIFISKTAISNFNSSILELNKNQFLLNDAMEKVSLVVKNISEIINSINFRNNINEIIDVLQANLLTLSYKVEDIVNSILFAKSNTLHPSILTSTELFHEIISSFKNLPKYKEFPVELTLDNIYLLINLSDLITYYLDNKLIYVLRIPMVDLISYNLYKNVPIPVPHDKNIPSSFAMIVSSKSYIGLSEDRKTYFSIDNLDICKIIISKHFICKSIDVYNVATNPSCETDIMTKAVEVVPDKCKTSFIFGNIDVWHKLNGNRWIFVQSNPVRLTIQCDSNVTDNVISGTGILTLKPNCIAFCKETKLEAQENFRIITNPITSDFNIIKNTCCNIERFSRLKFNISSSSIKSINLDNLKLLNNLPEQIYIDKDDILPPEDIFNYTGFSLSLIAIIIVLSLSLYYFKTNKSLFCKKLVINQPARENIPISTPNTPPQLRI